MRHRSRSVENGHDLDEDQNSHTGGKRLRRPSDFGGSHRNGSKMSSRNDNDS